jgi:DNA polymerase-1
LLTLDIFDSDEQPVVQAEIVYPTIKLCKDLSELNFSDKSGKYVIDCQIGGAQIYFDGTQYSVEISNSLLEGISFENYADLLKKILSNSQNQVVLFNVKKFMHDFEDYNFAYNCRLDDLSLMKYLVDFFDDSDDVEHLCANHGYDKQYSAFAMSEIYNNYAQKLQEEGEQELYENIEKPLINVLYDMERTGVCVDGAELDNLGKTYRAKLDELSNQIYAMCDCQFNINSPVQLGEVLFQKLGLKSGKKGKNGKYSTSADILEKLAEENEVVRLILSYRQYQKLYSTYVEGFKPLINKSGKVHTTYNQTITTTGRLSSANPNLQNIPIREDEGRELRKLFVPQQGNVLIDADYSQIELRLLAHFSGCKQLIDAYNRGEDIHAVTASQVFGVPLNEVTIKMRREAKAVNFGIIYGISDYGLAKNLNIPVKTAREYIQKYFEMYSQVKDYMDENVKIARNNGYVATLTGRKRYIREINSSNFNLRQFGERAAMNMPLQGSSADIIKIAMLNVARALKEKGLKAKLILQVHDELVLDAPENEAEQAGEILKYEMENAVKLNVPLTVEVHTGKNWYEAK